MHVSVLVANICVGVNGLEKEIDVVVSSTLRMSSAALD